MFISQTTDKSRRSKPGHQLTSSEETEEEIQQIVLGVHHRSFFNDARVCHVDRMFRVVDRQRDRLCQSQQEKRSDSDQPVHWLLFKRPAFRYFHLEI